MTRRISRRHLLRGAGGAAVALPFLGAMDRPARAASFPKRFVVFFTGLGTVRDKWLPTGSETSFTLGEILSPLAPFQDQLLVLDGIDMESAYHGPGDAHQLGIAQALSGTELLDGELFEYACGGGAVGWGGGITLDQMLADAIGGKTKLGSLELGVQVEYAHVSNRISYRGPAMPVPPDDDPWSVFGRLTSDLTTDARWAEIRRARRHRVLDAVTEDYRALSSRVGSEDRIKLDAHLGALEDIEKRLDTVGPVTGGTCQVPELGDRLPIYENDNYPVIGRLQLDLLAMALACDLTRVASVLWSSVQAGKVFTWLGQDEAHHDLSHSNPSNPAAQQKLVDIGRWHAGELAYLLGKLAALPEGDGTVLDNTIILWCTDIAQGQSHARRQMPYVIAGGGGGALKTGRFLRYEGAWHNDLLVALAQAMGVGIETFGNPAYCTGALPGLAG